MFYTCLMSITASGALVVLVVDIIINDLTKGFEQSSDPMPCAVNPILSSRLEAKVTITIYTHVQEVRFRLPFRCLVPVGCGCRSRSLADLACSDHNITRLHLHL